MFGYRVPAPDEAMLISGRGGGPQGAPFRVIIGHGAFVTPVFRKVRYLTLSMQEAEVAEQCVTHQGIALNVRAVIAFKVGNDPESIVNAGQRFLSDQDQMSLLTGRIFAGHLRSIIGSMTVEEIVTERQKLATEVLDGSKGEMAKIGVINAQAELAQQQAQLRQQQLVSEVVKPAEAEAERIRILALADAERTRIQAEAAASNNRVALDQMLINQLPLIVKEAAAGLAGANVSVLNGADGLSEIAAGLVGQGMTILDAVRKGMPGPGAQGDNGRVVSGQVASREP